VNVPFLQTATFTGLVSTDDYLTSQEWSDAFNISTTYQLNSGTFVTNSLLSGLSGLLLPITQYQEVSGNWQNTYTTVTNNSSSWNTAYSIATFYSQNSAILIEQTTFSELTSLKHSSQLKPGQLYQINDFQLMWWNLGQNAVQILSSDVIEPLIVQAIKNDKLRPEALSVLYTDDIVYYDIEARASTTWSAGPSDIPNFKGWIYRRVDSKKNIDIPWDWRHITHNCCTYDIYTVPLYIPDTTYNRGSLVRSPLQPNKLFISIINNNRSSNATPATNWSSVTNLNDDSVIYFPTFESGTGTIQGSNFFEVVLNLSPVLSSRAQFYTFTDSITSSTPPSNLTTKPYINNIKINDIESCHTIFNCNNNNSININSIIIDSSCQNNLFNINTLIGVTNVHIGNYFAGNFIFNTFANNNIENNFQNNSIVFGFNNNIVGNNASLNIFNTTTFNNIEDNFLRNILGSNFANNNINNNCSDNSFSQGFSFNNLGSNFNNNIIGNNCNYNVFGDICQYNTLSSFFQYNTIETDFSYNSVDVSFYENTIQNTFTNNSLGTNFHSNSIRSNFQNNIIGDNFNNVNIGSEVQSINFIGATHVYNIYEKNIFKNYDLVTRLSYYNSTDQLVITDPTA
jgi:hypothetical protein